MTRGRIGALVFVEGPESPALALLVPPALRDAPPGTVVEICPAAAALAASLGERLARHPGMALFVDYGYFPSRPGPTLAALRRHRAVVDPRYARRGRSERPCRFRRVRRGGDGCRRRRARPGAAAAISCSPSAPRRGSRRCRGGPTRRSVPRWKAALARLIDPAQMGTLFKVLALTSPGLPPPAGLCAAPGS